MRSITALDHGIPFMRGVARLVGPGLLGSCLLAGCFSPGADITGSSSSGGTSGTSGTASTEAASVTVAATEASSSGTTTSEAPTTGSTTSGSTTSTASSETNVTSTGSTGSTTAAEVPYCGDGMVTEPEECDDGNAIDEDGCTTGCTFTPYLVVFVSSSEYEGSALLGVLLADAECMTLAAAQPALAGRTFVAWLSSPGFDAKARIGTSQSVYRLPDADKTQVASNTAALLSGKLDAPIDHHEDGDVVGAPLVVWTGTAPDGVATGADCGGWSMLMMGTVGLSTAMDAAWTQSEDVGCAASRRIYCIETPPV